MEAEPIRITRYPNRRLYDHQQRRYVTLAEVEELVRAGNTVAVRDSRTGEDLTRSILAQLILERHPERMELFPVAILHTMIRANDLALGFLRDYLRLAMTYLEALQQTPATRPFPSPLDWLRSFLPAASPAPARPAEPPPEQEGATAAELAHRVAELERRLAELEASADKPEPATPPRPASPVDGSNDSRH